MVAFRSELGVGAMRVAVFAQDPLARAGLVAVLAGDPGVQVLDRAERPVGAQAAVWDGPIALPGFSQRFSEAMAASPVVALVADAHAAAEALGAGARGVLLRDVEPRMLLAALRAVASGLTILGPGLEKTRPAAQRARPSEPLTAREREVLGLLAEARSNKEIGQRLGISEHTAKFHVNAVLAKLGVQRRTEAVIEAAKLGLISI